ncbi:hypothetical protein [uncultured Thiodictyon sp.]|jgi:hypothetical protein|uniref:hypothetical protein n=1 Tax=uncultured Thiodictyon sp. TaxID=1846217 RepID=UPI0025E87B41|nr:hypothetical protein [uncultured Thiodictyon sp.]
MDRKYILTILVAGLLGFIGAMLLMPPTIQDEKVRLPWRVTTNRAGDTQVFGFTLGETRLAELRRFFGEDGTINLFETPGAREPLTVEVYFEQVYLQSLRADFIITLDVDQATLKPMYERGLRISKMESGDKKIKLDPTDVETLLARPIRSITYLPQARLDNETIEKRFGPPSERRLDPSNGIIHWLYPDRGFDIARNTKGKIVIQYVNRADFSRLALPLAGAQTPADPGTAPP